MMGRRSRKQGKSLRERSAETRAYVGIDVCKAWLDAYLHPVLRRLRVANDRDGLKRLKRSWTDLRSSWRCWRRPANITARRTASLNAQGTAVVIVYPLRSRLFAEALGRLPRPDAIDARLLAILGESLGPAAAPPPPEAMEELQELLAAS